MTSILVFLIVLSILVFFHELGHFLAAKACGIYVDRFSVGMPPRLFGKRIGETDYCIGALPIGGYVKMAGQEDAPLTEEEREKEYGEVPPERWFNNKPVWKRYIVIAAGPLMNLVLAVVLFAIMIAIGGMVAESELEARIGEVEPDSPARSAKLYLYEENKQPEDYTGNPDAVGLQTGDLIVRMDGDPVHSIMELATGAVLGGPGTSHYLELDRKDENGAITRYVTTMTPEVLEEVEYPRFGVSPFASAMVGEALPDTPAAAAGLQANDIIERANGEPVDQAQFIALMEDAPVDVPVVLNVLRGEERIKKEIIPTTIGRVRGIYTKETKQGLQVQLITDDMQEKIGLQRKDILLTLNGAPATQELLSELQKAEMGNSLEVEILRPTILFGLIQRKETLTAEIPVEPVQAVGVTLVTRLLPRDVPASRILPEAFRESYKALEDTLMTLKALIVRDVSMKNIGGPAMIFGVVTQAAEAGFDWLLRITAIISINLCVFNLLPLPVLDGGLLVIHGYEGIFRKPMNIKVQERIQQVGLFLIIGLMVFVTWNDIARFIQQMIP